jgi:hypothetical protein
MAWNDNEMASMDNSYGYGYGSNSAQQDSEPKPPTFGELAGTSAYWKPENIGDTITGTIESWETEPYKAYGATEQARSKSGKLKWQYRVILSDTGLKDKPDDDGRRTLYLKTWQVTRNIVEGLKTAGFDPSNGPQKGMRMRVTYTGDDKPFAPGFRGAKILKFDFQPGHGNAAPSSPQGPRPLAPSAPASQQTTGPAIGGEAGQKVLALAARGQSAERISQLTGIRLDAVKQEIAASKTDNPQF